MKNSPLICAGLLGCLAVGLMPGCQRTPLKASKAPVNVTVFRPVEKPDVVDYMYFTGHAKAVEIVDVKPRVSGYLDRIAFENGGFVRGPSLRSSKAEVVAAGLVHLSTTSGVSGALVAAAILCPEAVEADVLFEIDPRPYQANYDLAASQVDLNKAKFDSATAIYKLNLDAFNRGKDIGAGVVVISPQQLETYRAAKVEAEASWRASQASLEVAKYDLVNTKVHAAVSGNITYNRLTKGNLVTKDVTSLAQVSSHDPMYVYFDIDEQSTQELQIAQRQGAFKHFLNTPVFAGLSKDKGQYPLQGKLDYIDPQIDPSMGSRTFRAVFDNARSGNPADQATQLGYLRGGNFVRVKLSKGKAPYPAPIVPEKALIAEQGNKYLLVADAQNKVRKEAVKLGALLDNGLRVVLPPDSLKMTDKEWAERWAKEWVILDGVGEAQDKGDVAVSKSFRLLLGDGSLQELKDDKVTK
jgi:RND family efflux transporter MFP subunit